MGKCYVKAYYDWIEQTAALTDAERGRLFIAILEYARTGIPPELDGAESILFPVFRTMLDRDDELSAERSRNGAKGGKQTQASSSKIKQTEANANDPKPTKTKKEDKDKDKDKSARTRDADAFAAFAAGDGDLLAVLKDFEKMRRSIKKPLTDTAKKLLVNKLENNFPPEQWKPVLEQSIVKCWQDIYPLKEQEQQRLGVVAHSEKASAQQLESLKEIYRKVKGEQR